MSRTIRLVLIRKAYLRTHPRTLRRLAFARARAGLSVVLLAFAITLASVNPPGGGHSSGGNHGHHSKGKGHSTHTPTW